MKSVTVIGLGYVGLPTTALIAESYDTVRGVDINEQLVSDLRHGNVNIEEPGLTELLVSAVNRGTLSYSSSVITSDVYVIAVPTPFQKSSKVDVPTPDMSFVYSVINAISPLLKKGDLVILESTSPVGTTKDIAAKIQNQRPDLKILDEQLDLSPDIHFAYCPERVLPGNAINEVRNNDRVIGGLTKECASVAREFYQLFVTGECVETISSVAEAVKLSENSYRDVNIAFANELSLICDRYDISVEKVIQIANMHPRVNILQPGVGVGGHCIAVDPWFLIHENLDTAHLMHTARKVNKFKTNWVIDNIQDEILKVSPITNIILYGMAYKPDIGDLRESPSIQILLAIKKLPNIKLYCVEPYVTDKSIHGVPNISVASAQKLQALHILLIPHEPFTHLDTNNSLYLDYR